MRTGSLLSTWSMPASAAAFSCISQGSADTAAFARTHARTRYVRRSSLTPDSSSTQNTERHDKHTRCMVCLQRAPHRHPEGCHVRWVLTWATRCRVAWNAASSLASSTFIELVRVNSSSMEDKLAMRTLVLLLCASVVSAVTIRGTCDKPGRESERGLESWAADWGLDSQGSRFCV